MSFGESLDRLVDAQQDYLKACQTYGADSAQAQAADQKADAEEARHIREHYQPGVRH